MQRVKIILHEADSTKQNMQYVKLFYTDRWWTLVTAFLNVFFIFSTFCNVFKNCSRFYVYGSVHVPWTKPRQRWRGRAAAPNIKTSNRANGDLRTRGWLLGGPARAPTRNPQQYRTLGAGAPDAFAFNPPPVRRSSAMNRHTRGNRHCNAGWATGCQDHASCSIFTG